mmetsp:Transcript_2792/g.6212  ORF Transcript_2792/g.6212 Transcript_2792/m.6212 type:complete len:356 (-) Transcript_2792:1394-2461(-)
MKRLWLLLIIKEKFWPMSALLLHGFRSVHRGVTRHGRAAPALPLPGRVFCASNLGSEGEASPSYPTPRQRRLEKNKATHKRSARNRKAAPAGTRGQAGAAPELPPGFDAATSPLSDFVAAAVALERVGSSRQMVGLVDALADRLPALGASEGGSEGGSEGAVEWFVGRVFGEADGRLARGMLALVSKGLRGAPLAEALEVDPLELAERSGLGAFLTPSRTNGLASLVKTVQDLLKREQAVRGRLQRQQDGAAEKLTGGKHPEAEAAEAEAKGGSAQYPALGLVQEVWSGSVQAEEVAVLLSGGVDSSVALRLAQEHGYKARCFYLKASERLRNFVFLLPLVPLIFAIPSKLFKGG